MANVSEQHGPDEFRFEWLETLNHAIRELLIEELNPHPRTMAWVDRQLVHLERSAARQNNKDWAYTILGVAFTIAVKLDLEPELSQKLLDMVSGAVKLLAPEPIVD